MRRRAATGGQRISSSMGMLFFSGPLSLRRVGFRCVAVPLPLPSPPSPPPSSPPPLRCPARISSSLRRAYELGETSPSNVSDANAPSYPPHLLSPPLPFRGRGTTGCAMHRNDVWRLGECDPDRARRRRSRRGGGGWEVGEDEEREKKRRHSRGREHDVRRDETPAAEMAEVVLYRYQVRKIGRARVRPPDDAGFLGQQ